MNPLLFSRIVYPFAFNTILKTYAFFFSYRAFFQKSSVFRQTASDLSDNGHNEKCNVRIEQVML